MASIAGTPDVAAVTVSDVKPPAGLARDAVGLPSVLFMIVTGAAPITAMLFNVPVAVSGAGSAAPAGFVLATIALTIFSVGYVAMARRITAAGGFYSFISHGLGQTVAAGAGMLIWMCYIGFAASVLGVCGYFAHTTLQDFFSINVPAWTVELVALGLMSLLSWFHIELTAKVLGVFLTCEVIALAVLGISIMVQGGAHGFSAAPFDPTALFSNGAAIKVFGAAAAGVALFGAFWSWVGFEMAPNYAEESREPKRLMGPATYISVIGLGILYTFMAYMFVTGWGNTGSAQRGRRPVRGQDRIRLLSADQSVLRRLADRRVQGPDHDQLVCLRDRLLQHVGALRLLDGPRAAASSQALRDATTSTSHRTTPAWR